MVYTVCINNMCIIGNRNVVYTLKYSKPGVYREVGPGRLCSKHHLLFYSFILPNFIYYASQVAYYSRIIPSVCRGSHTHRLNRNSH